MWWKIFGIGKIRESFKIKKLFNIWGSKKESEGTKLFKAIISCSCLMYFILYLLIAVGVLGLIVGIYEKLPDFVKKLLS